MSNATSMMYWNDRLQSSQPRVTTLLFSITAAKTVTDVLRSPTLTSFDTAITQAQIDAHLATTTEFAAAAFDATALGADAFAGVVNMGGQVAELYAVCVRVHSTTGGAVEKLRFVEDSATLTASTLASECAKGANGNVAFKTAFGLNEIDALTSGQIEVVIYWRAK